jgi:hypothetical protein
MRRQKATRRLVCGAGLRSRFAANAIAGTRPMEPHNGDLPFQQFESSRSRTESPRHSVLAQGCFFEAVSRNSGGLPTATVDIRDAPERAINPDLAA